MFIKSALFCITHFLLINVMLCSGEETCETVPTEIHVTKGKMAREEILRMKIHD